MLCYDNLRTYAHDDLIKYQNTMPRAMHCLSTIYTSTANDILATSEIPNKYIAL